MASRLQAMIDPNNITGVNSIYNNIPVPLEDLTISAQLSVEKKSRTILTADKQGTYRTTEKGVNIKFIEGSQIGNTKSLTTKYTDLTAINSDDNNGEALGITSIDIDFNSQYAPQITIQFIDVRGSAIFQNEDKLSKGDNKYSVFFQFPYPLYKLSIKGYYGQQVEYCLHMLKFNSRFNSQTGNFEITAQFVGYTYSMLSDALVGYMKAIEYTTIGGLRYKTLKEEQNKKNPESPLYTLNELFLKISEINKIIDNLIATNPEIDTLNNSEIKLNQLEIVKNNVTFNLAQQVLSTLKNDIKNNNNSFTIYIDSQKTEVDKFLSTYNTAITQAITTFNENSEINLTNTLFTNISFIRYTGNDLKTNPNNKEILDFLTSINFTFSDDTVLNVFDNRPLLDNISEKETKLRDSIDILKPEIATLLDNAVKGQIGFRPTVRSIINTIATSIEVLFYSIYKVAEAATTNSKREEILKNLFNLDEKKSDIKKNDPIYPWPGYQKFEDKVGYTETYLGEEKKISLTDKSNIDEILFIEDLLTAFLTSQKNSEEIQKIINEQTKNWFPVSPLDTRNSNTNPYEPYSDKRQKSLSHLDIIRKIMLRAITFLGVSNKNLRDDEIIKMATAEYNAVVYGTDTKELLNALTGQKIDTYLKITGSYNNGVSERKDIPLIKENGGEYVYEYITNNDISVIPINGEFNNGTWPSTIGELLDKKNNNSVFITNYSNSENSSDKPDDGGEYVKIITRTTYEENSTNELPTSNEISAIDLTNLRGGTNSAFDVFNGPSGIQSFERLNYNADGIASQISDFDYRYIYYALDATQATDLIDDITQYSLLDPFNKYSNKVNSLGYTRIDSGEKGVPTKTNYDSYFWEENKWKRKKDFRVLQEKDFKENDIKPTNIHKNYGKNIELIYESVIGGKKIVYPFIDFCVVEESTKILGLKIPKSNKIIPISLFGSNLYYQQTEENAKAILFLHTFPWRGLIEEDGVTGVGKSIFDVGEIINSFAERAGFVSVPRLWVAFIGGMLWRSKQTIDPIKFYRTGVNGGIVESFLPNFTSNNEETYPKTNQYLLYQDPFKRDSEKQYGMLFREETDNDYKKIDSTLLNLPEQAKNEFIKVFDEFVDGDWLSIKSKLEVLDTNNIGSTWTTKYDSLITNSNLTTVDGYYKMSTSILKGGYKNYENYIMFSPYYKTGDNPYKYNYWLELQDDATINGELINLYKQELIISNTTYRIWDNSNTTQSPRSKITVDKEDLTLYLNTITKQFSGKTESYGSKEDENRKQAIFGTGDNSIIKLQLYKNCKNIYDKWIANSKDGDSIFFQCNDIEPGGTKRLIDSFRFLTRSFSDIGDIMAINPIPILNYLTEGLNSSSYDMITSILSANYFTFLPLPNFVNYRDEKMLESIFTPYPTYNEDTTTIGPTFICTYVGDTSKTLTFNSSNYTTDGFNFGVDNTEVPEDFTEELKNDDIPVTVFKVAYGQQNQNLFKDITLDQSEFSETAESLYIQDDISQKGNPKNRTLGGQNMYNVWSVRSYTAQIEMMGNAMIQPMMYFQLENIPLFRGAYMITRVKHSIKPNHMSTNFTGVKIRRTMTKTSTVTDFYMSYLDSLQTKKTSGTGGAVGAVGTPRNALPPIVRTIYENGGTNGNIEVNYISLQQVGVISGVQQDVDSLERRKMLAEAVPALTEMLKAFVDFARLNNYPTINDKYINITSLYRSYEYQSGLYEKDKAKNGGKPSGAVALPGTSNHSWGIAVDLRFVPQKEGNSFKLNSWSPVSTSANKEGFSFEYNPSLKWFLDNGYKFGFIIPNDLRDGVGIDEYWHFEYHGTSAKCIYSKLPTTYKYTASLTEKYNDVVKNPKDKDGKEAVYLANNCDYLTVKSADGSGDLTSTAYPDIKPTNDQITTINSLSGTWDKRATTFIKKFEGFSEKTKLDAGTYRGGYGTDIIITYPGAPEVKVTSQTTYTQQTADLTLQYDISNRFRTSVIGVLGQTNWDKLNDNQKAAIISYSYNAGAGTLKTRGIVDAITKNNYKLASQEIFDGPITEKGKGVLNGLIRRRKSESILFDKPV